MAGCDGLTHAGPFRLLKASLGFMTNRQDKTPGEGIMNRIKALAGVPAQRIRAATVLAMAGMGLAACSTNQGPPRPVAMVPAAPVKAI